MFCPDWEQDVILLSHMGESNPKLAQWKPLISDCPFNYNSCGDTTAMYNCLRKGKAVYVNPAPMQDHFNLIVSGVEMLDEGLERGAYRHSTQGWMKPCKPLPQFLKEFSWPAARTIPPWSTTPTSKRSRRSAPCWASRSSKSNNACAFRPGASGLNAHVRKRTRHER